MGTAQELVSDIRSESNQLDRPEIPRGIAMPKNLRKASYAEKLAWLDKEVAKSYQRDELWFATVRQLEKKILAYEALTNKVAKVVG